jgi:uncharacterized protein (UPF0212 family)
MHALSASELLVIWEQGQGQSSVHRALFILKTACPEMQYEEIEQLSIGKRDSYLLALREWAFGQEFVSLIKCPVCGEGLEQTFNTANIRKASKSIVHYSEEERIEGVFTLNIDNYEIGFRLPNSRDLTEIGQNDNAANMGKKIFERCLFSTHCNGEEQSANMLPENVVNEVIEQMSKADPMADIRLTLSCPGCNHEWDSIFDIASFFWSEINTWALRTIREVHILAKAYGWSENDILAMSPWRRQIYMEMVKV